MKAHQRQGERILVETLHIRPTDGDAAKTITPRGVSKQVKNI